MAIRSGCLGFQIGFRIDALHLTIINLALIKREIVSSCLSLYCLNFYMGILSEMCEDTFSIASSFLFWRAGDGVFK